MQQILDFFVKMFPNNSRDIRIEICISFSVLFRSIYFKPTKGD